MSSRELEVLVKSGTPLVVVRTHDPVNLVSEIAKDGLGDANVYYVGVGRSGWVLCGSGGPNISFNNPGDLFRGLNELCPWAKTNDKRAVVLVTGLGQMLEGNPVGPQMMLDWLPQAKVCGVTLVLIQSPGYHLGGYLTRYAQYLDDELPTVDRLREVVEGFKSSTGKDVAPTVTQNLRGLTIWEAEQVMFTEYIRRGKGDLSPSDVLRAKEEIINSTPGLSLISSVPKMEDVQGLENLKRFMLATAPDPRAMGVVMLGVQGTGKSMAAMATASALERPLVALNLGAVMGSKVGQSEAQMRQALDVVASVRPCVLLVDEIEKMLSGTESSGRTDGGTTNRVASDFLKFLQDRPEGIYVAATCNDVSQVPPEYLRAERWDAIFFVDLPTAEEREAILRYYLKSYGLTDTTVSAEELSGWTGAEIKSLVRIASMMQSTLAQAKAYVIPISTTREEEIRHLREVWGPRCVPASIRDEKKNMVFTGVRR